MWRNLRYSILAILVLAAIITPATDILNICLFLLPDGRALQNEHRSGLAGKSRARAQGKRSIVPSLQFRLMQEFGASATTRPGRQTESANSRFESCTAHVPR